MKTIMIHENTSHESKVIKTYNAIGTWSQVFEGAKNTVEQMPRKGKVLVKFLEGNKLHTFKMFQTWK